VRQIIKHYNRIFTLSVHRVAFGLSTVVLDDAWLYHYSARMTILLARVLKGTPCCSFTRKLYF